MGYFFYFFGNSFIIKTIYEPQTHKKYGLVIRLNCRIITNQIQYFKKNNCLKVGYNSSTNLAI